MTEELTDEQSDASSADEHPQDLKGCFFFAFRATGCILWLYITMFIAIACAAILSLLFYR